MPAQPRVRPTLSEDARTRDTFVPVHLYRVGIKTDSSWRGAWWIRGQDKRKRKRPHGGTA